MIKITRQCVICGKDFEITLGDNGEIPDDIYYCGIKLPPGNREYWECPKCFKPEEG